MSKFRNVHYLNGIYIPLLCLFSLIILNIGLFRYYKYILIVPLHQVFLTGIFLNDCRICLKALSLSRFPRYFFLIPCLTRLQFPKLTAVLHLRKNVSWVEKKYPDNKG